MIARAGEHGLEGRVRLSRPCLPSDWPNRSDSEFVDLPDTCWHVQRRGQGPPLLLIHGTGAATHTWRGMFQPLARHFDVLAFDLPGHGFTERKSSGPMSMDRLAGAISELLDALQFTPTAIVGHSAGAALAIRLCLDAKRMPAKIFGLNAALWPFGGAFAPLLLTMTRLVAAIPLLPSVVDWRARDPANVRRMIEGTGSVPDAEGIRCYQALLAREAHVDATVRMMADWDLSSLTDEMATIADRCHLITASNDRAVPPVAARRLQQRYPSITLTELPDLGHLAHEESPALFSRHVIDSMQAGKAHGR